LHRRPPLFISGFVGLTAVEECIFPVALLDRLQSGHVSSVIRNLILETKLTAPERYERLRKRLARDFDFHLDKVLFDSQKDLYVTAQYSEVCDNSNLSLDFSASGSGFMQILQILAPIYRFCPDSAEVVLLDEPDAHLHPNLQTTLASSLRRIQQELGIQIIISTHSTSIIRAASPSEVVPITSTAKVCKPLTTKADMEQEIRSKLDSYNLAKSVISGKLLFFEDTDTTALEEFDTLLNTKVFNGANTAPVIRGRGKTDRIPFHIKGVIKEIIGEDVDVIFVRDGDGIPPTWRAKLEEFGKQKHVNLVISERFEIESYLLNPGLILRALQSKYKEAVLPSTADVEAKIKEALKNTITLSKYHYDDDLAEEITQCAQLMGSSEYRNAQLVKSEVRNWHSTLENFSELSDLLIYGKGKESLAIVLAWLNKLGLNIAHSSLVSAVQAADIPQEIKTLLAALRSKEQKENPELLPVEVVCLEDNDELEEKVEHLLFDLDSQETWKSKTVGMPQPRSEKGSRS
jgi:hypothetical protein